MSPTYQHFYIWRAQKFDLKKKYILITSLILWCYGFVSNMGIDEYKEHKFFKLIIPSLEIYRGRFK